MEWDYRWNTLESGKRIKVWWTEQDGVRFTIDRVEGSQSFMWRAARGGNSVSNGAPSWVEAATAAVERAREVLGS